MNQGPLGYFGQHKRVWRTRGKARTYLCSLCGSQASEWSWIHDTDPNDPNNYRPLCIPCHRNYDAVAGEQHHNTGRKHSASAKEARSKNNQGRRTTRNTSAVPNVYLDKRRDKWQVQVHRTSGGAYSNFAEAVSARNELATRIYGPDTKQYNVDGSIK